jgi:hypothetical protein
LPFITSPIERPVARWRRVNGMRSGRNASNRTSSMERQRVQQIPG